MIFDPQTGQYINIDEFKTRQRFNDFRKVIDSVNAGIENLHDSLMKFTESFGISYDEKHWLPLVFQKYGTEGIDKDLIAYSYERLKDVTKANTFQEWFARSLRELFKETEEG